MAQMTWKQFQQPYVGSIDDLRDLLWPVRTTAQLASITDAINTTDKFQGKQVFNSTSGLVVVADLGTAAGTWSATSDGLVDHTPV